MGGFLHPSKSCTWLTPYSSSARHKCNLLLLWDFSQNFIEFIQHTGPEYARAFFEIILKRFYKFFITAAEYGRPQASAEVDILIPVSIPRGIWAEILANFGNSCWIISYLHILLSYLIRLVFNLTCRSNCRDRFSYDHLCFALYSKQGKLPAKLDGCMVPCLHWLMQFFGSRLKRVVYLYLHDLYDFFQLFYSAGGISDL